MFSFAKFKKKKKKIETQSRGVPASYNIEKLGRTKISLSSLISATRRFFPSPIVLNPTSHSAMLINYLISSKTKSVVELYLTCTIIAVCDNVSWPYVLVHTSCDTLLKRMSQVS